jgi:hypothetical protein
MRPLILIVFAGAMLCPLASVAQPGPPMRWQPMMFHDLRTPSKQDPLQTIVWPDVIARENDYVTTTLKRPLDGKNAFVTALSSTYRDEDRTIFISTVLSRDCDSGANDKGADIEPSVCPLRIVVMRNGQVLLTKTETGCYADHSDPDLPARNRNDDSYTRFDPSTATISFRTSVGGRDVPRCAHTYSIK